MALDKAISTQNIEVFTNLDFTKQDTYEKRVFFPTLTYLGQIFAMFDGCGLFMRGKILDEKIELKLENNVWTDIPVNIVGAFVDISITALNPNSDARLSLMIASFVERHNMPIEMSDVKIKHKPEQGMSIMFDFSNAVDIARGCEEYLDREVQLLNSQAKVFSIKKDTSNFFWRNDKLYCKLPLVEKHKIRFRYESRLGWSEWSDWLEFICKRK